MSVKTILAATSAVLCLALPAHADGMVIEDAYARSASPTAQSGAAFMHIVNHTGEDDRLVGAASPAAKLVELHTHKEDANGVMQMIHVEEGFVVPAGETLVLERGGNHVMFMGLSAPFEQGATVPLTLTFESAGEVQVDVEVDLERMPDSGGMTGHSMPSSD